MTSEHLFYQVSITHLPAYSRTLNSPTLPFDISLAQLEHDTRVNTHSPILARLPLHPILAPPSAISRTDIYRHRQHDQRNRTPCLSQYRHREIVEHSSDLDGCAALRTAGNQVSLLLPYLYFGNFAGGK